MGAKVIHFGPDDCHRLMVLRSAGYSIDDCQSLMQLRACLDGGANPEALLMSDAADAQPHEALALARTHASLPVILFRTSNLTCEDSGVDLVVHCLTPPEVWLNEVDALIEKSRVVRAQLQVMARKPALLRRESALAMVQSRAERERLHPEGTRPPAPEYPSAAQRVAPKRHSK